MFWHNAVLRRVTTKGNRQMTDLSNGNGSSELSAQVQEQLAQAPTQYAELAEWVREVAELTQPANIYWVDGTEEEYDRLAGELVEAGTFKRLSDHEFPLSLIHI